MQMNNVTPRNQIPFKERDHKNAKCEICGAIHRVHGIIYISGKFRCHLCRRKTCNVIYGDKIVVRANG